MLLQFVSDWCIMVVIKYIVPLDKPSTGGDTSLLPMTTRAYTTLTQETTIMLNTELPERTRTFR